MEKEGYSQQILIEEVVSATGSISGEGISALVNTLRRAALRTAVYYKGNLDSRMNKIVSRILGGFDPASYGLSADFLLTKLTQMKGCGCKVPRAVGS